MNLDGFVAFGDSVTEVNLILGVFALGNGYEYRKPVISCIGGIGVRRVFADAQINRIADEATCSIIQELCAIVQICRLSGSDRLAFQARILLRRETPALNGIQQETT
jgi:hypothetical protein